MLARARAVFATRDRGASVVEYSLLVAGIAVIIVVVVFALGDAIAALFQSVDPCLEGAGAEEGCATRVGGGEEG